jgi:hypothetical protein
LALNISQASLAAGSRSAGACTQVRGASSGSTRDGDDAHRDDLPKIANLLDLGRLAQFGEE